MMPRNEGTILQIGSALAYRNIPPQSAYCVAKMAVRGFTDSLRSELIHDRSRIRLMMLHLPAVNTPQFDWVMPSASACPAGPAHLSARSYGQGSALPCGASEAGDVSGLAYCKSDSGKQDLSWIYRSLPRPDELRCPAEQPASGSEPSEQPVQAYGRCPGSWRLWPLRRQSAYRQSVVLGGFSPWLGSSRTCTDGRMASFASLGPSHFTTPF